MLKQRESLAKQLAELEEEIDALDPATMASREGGRRKPSLELFDLMAKHLAGLTIKENMVALDMDYPQAYMMHLKLNNLSKVVVNEETGKFILQSVAGANKQTGS